MMGIGFERHFTNDNLSVEKEHMKRHSTLLIIGGCKWKPQEPITTYLSGWLKKKEKKKDTDNTKCTEKDKEYYIALFGVQNGIASSAVSFKIKYIIILWPSNVILDIHPLKSKVKSPWKSLFIIAPNLEQPKCPSTCELINNTTQQ